MPTTTWTGRIRRAALLATLPLALGSAAVAAASPGHPAGPHRPAPSAADPVVSGPVTGGKGAIVLQATSFALSDVGYTQSEFFLSGTAASYAPAAPLSADGRWSIKPAGTAPYTSRIVVDRPADPRRFNGTVVVEWLNVSAGLDVAPDFVEAHNELIREGFAWVGVSAQAVGLNATKAADPVRYAALSHPGDSFSYDIYSQAGQAVRDSARTVLGGLRPRTVLAEGESQSAFRLSTYIDAVQPLVHEYDGFLVHSRGAGGTALTEPPQSLVLVPNVVPVRPDLGVPVLTVETETDLTTLGFVPARQPDTDSFRLWELAGTAHADAYIANLGSPDRLGSAGQQEFDAMLNPPTGTPAFTCATPINTGQMHYVLDTAQFALNRWVSAHVPPARAPRIEMDTSGPTPTIVRDADGNAKGGLRTPAVQAPVAALSGQGQSGSLFCFLFGTTTPFSADRLAQLYPSHRAFVARWTAATVRDTRAGFIRPADAVELIRAGARSAVGRS